MRLRTASKDFELQVGIMVSWPRAFREGVAMGRGALGVGRTLSAPWS